MEKAMIAPQGLIRGTVKEKESGFLRHDALVYGDGYVQHYAKVIKEGAIWERMHKPFDVEPGVSKADFPAPLAVGDKLGMYGANIYESLIVRDGDMFRYLHNNDEWRQIGDNPVFKGVTGVPTMFRAHDDMFGVLPSTIQAIVPTEIGLFQFSFITDYDFWIPRRLLTRQKTGWPTGFVSYYGGFDVYYPVADKLHGVMFNANPSYPGTFDYDANINPLNGAATGVQGLPSIDFDGPYPTLDQDAHNLIVPEAKQSDRGFFRLVHYWKEGYLVQNWNETILPGSYSGNASLVSLGPKSMLKSDQSHKGSDDLMMALAPVGADIYEIRRRGDTGEWGDPTKAI